jgi:hypothetical protein
MTNRLRVLDILDKHFADYQIFFFTYDKVWYESSRPISRPETRPEIGPTSNSPPARPTTETCRSSDRNVHSWTPLRATKRITAARLPPCMRAPLEAKLKRFCGKKPLKVRFTENLNECKSDNFWKAVKRPELPGNGKHHYRTLLYRR